MAATQPAATQTPLTPSEYVRQFGYKNGPAFRAPLVDVTNAIGEAVAAIRESPFRTKFMAEVGTQLQTVLDQMCRVVHDFDVTDSSRMDYKTADGTFYSSRPLPHHVRGADAKLSDASLVALVACFIAQLRQRVFSLGRSRIAGQYSTDLIEALNGVLALIPEQAEKSIFVHARPRKAAASQGDAAPVDDQEADIDDNDLETAAEAAASASGKPEMREIKVWYEPFVEQVANAFSQAKKAQAIASTAARAAKAAEPKQEGADDSKKSDKPKKPYIRRPTNDEEEQDAAPRRKYVPPKYSKAGAKPKTKADSEGWTTVTKH